MGGLSIALDDSLADPFVNPSRAFGVQRMFLAPFNHNITGGHGGGRTLPMGGVLSRGDWAGSFLVAVQDLDHKTSSNALSTGWYNRYAQAGVAKRVGNDLTVGASGYVGRLNAIDGADLLFDGSDAITDVGTMTDFRLAATKHWGDRRLEAIVLNSRSSITHAVEWSGNIFNPGGPGIEHYHEIDHNEDKTNIWGAHLAYSMPLDFGWRFGWIMTGNRLSHPKIPNYEFKETRFVAWDPGTTWAYNFGVGLSRTVKHTSFGFDLIQEPMTSDTWGEDANGAHTVDNHFNFFNVKWRAGFSHDLQLARDSSQLLGFQFGISRYGVGYDLDQVDHVAGTTRHGREDWAQWTPTFGLRLHTGAFDLQYNYRITCSQRCIELGMGDKISVPGVAIMGAPTSAVMVDGGTSRFHQLMLSVPVR
jgi:hypothetical protein